MKYSVECSTDVIAAITVFEEDLGGSTSDRSGLSAMTLKFTLTAESPERGNANELQAADAVAQATEGVNAVDPIPRPVDLMGPAVDTTTNVVTEVQTLDNTWGVLLDRIELFNEIVTDIAQVLVIRCLVSLFLNARQVHPYASLAWSVISAANKVCPSVCNRTIAERGCISHRCLSARKTATSKSFD